jgi:hypothetical protein
MELKMIVSNAFKDYSMQELSEIRDSVHEMNDFLIKTNEIYTKEKTKPTKTEDNVIYIDPSIKVEFDEMKELSVLFHEAVSVYREWHVKIFNLAVKNIGSYSNPKVQSHIGELVAICATFGILVREMKA